MDTKKQVNFPKYLWSFVHMRDCSCVSILQFLRATRSIEHISYGNVAGWLAGWLAVCHSRYCIKTTKPILKLFRPSGSPIIEAFRTPCADTKFQGEPLHRGRLIHGGGGNWRFSTYIAVYLGNGARKADGYYGTLIGSRGCRI